MNKQESQNLMIGSWVLAEGKPRQVHSLTTKKAGFKRGTNGQRDFFRFDQLQGIPLSEPLLKECVTVNPPKSLIPEFVSVEFMRDIVVIKEGGETIDYLRFPNLHTMQSFFLTRYDCIVEFDVEKYKEVAPMYCVILSDMKNLNMSSIEYEKKEFAGLGDVVYIMPKDKVDDSGLKSDKAMFDELFRTPPDGFIMPDGKQGYILRELSDEEKRDFSKNMGWIKD